MKKLLFVLGLVACLSTLGTDDLLAQGRGSAAGRGLGNAAGAAAAGQGIGRASGTIANSRPSGSAATGAGRGSAASRTSAGTQRAGNSITRGLPTQARATSPDRQAMNQERIADHRYQQAEHLRSISERNGNDALVQTADRMEISASRNFQRNTSADADSVGQEIGSEAAASVTAPPSAQRGTSAKRGFWFRAR